VLLCGSVGSGGTGPGAGPGVEGRYGAGGVGLSCGPELESRSRRVLVVAVLCTTVVAVAG